MKPLGMRSLLPLIMVFFSAQLIAQDLETITHKVSVEYDNERQQNVFFIGGVNTPSLELLRGVTYIFDLSDPTLSNHPFKFSIIKDGVHNSGVQFTDSVKSEGVRGTPGAKIALTVFSNSKSNIYFYCEFHPGMGGDSQPSISGESSNLFKGLFNPVSNSLSVPKTFVDTTPATLYSLKLNLLSDGKSFGLLEAIKGEVNEHTMIDPLQPKFLIKDNLLEIPSVSVEGKQYEVTLKFVDSAFSVYSAQEKIPESPQEKLVVDSPKSDYDPDGY
ncbi:MAG: hypothetical protein P8K11_07610 [Gammaproteobacteria bacterium]|nr:hypothetical protein [Gammaproteobacteria bacterium]